MSEPTLRHLFGETPPASIDVSSVIRRSRARRAPRVIGAGALSVLTLCTVAWFGFGGLAGSPASDTGGAVAPMAESDMSSQGEANNKYATTDGCGGPVGDVTSGDVAVALALRSTESASVTITNTGSSAVTGLSYGPTLVLARDGVIVWQGDSAAQLLDLPAGSSQSYDAAFAPVACSTQPLSGTYQLLARFELPDGVVVGASKDVVVP